MQAYTTFCKFLNGYQDQSLMKITTMVNLGGYSFKRGVYSFLLHNSISLLEPCFEEVKEFARLSLL